MIKLLNTICLIEAVIGIGLAIILHDVNGYIFGGGFILGSIFTFLITMGLGLMATSQEKTDAYAPKTNHADYKSI